MADGHVERPNPSFGGKKLTLRELWGFEISKKQTKVTGGIKKILGKMTLLKVGENQKIVGHTKFYQNELIAANTVTPLLQRQVKVF